MTEWAIEKDRVLLSEAERKRNTCRSCACSNIYTAMKERTIKKCWFIAGMKRRSDDFQRLHKWNMMFPAAKQKKQVGLQARMYFRLLSLITEKKAPVQKNNNNKLRQTNKNKQTKSLGGFECVFLGWRSNRYFSLFIFLHRFKKIDIFSDSFLFYLKKYLIKTFNPAILGNLKKNSNDHPRHYRSKILDCH